MLKKHPNKVDIPTITGAPSQFCVIKIWRVKDFSKIFAHLKTHETKMLICRKFTDTLAAILDWFNDAYYIVFGWSYCHTQSVQPQFAIIIVVA